MIPLNNAVGAPEGPVILGMLAGLLLLALGRR
jgi:uncharacterized protein (TIGR03382 family)